MQLPKFGTSLRELSMLQTQWAQFLNPIISLPMLQQNTLKNVKLTGGANTNINHGLGRVLQGWFLVRIRPTGAAVLYDDQDNNPIPDKTLILFANSTVVVDLVVF